MNKELPNTLSDFIDYLEDNATKFPHIQSIGQHFFQIRKKYEEAKNEENAKKSQIENCCFSFFLNNGYLKPSFSCIDGDGKNWEFPKIEDFSEDDLEYIEERYKETKNPILLSRYSHILWIHPKKKHRSFLMNSVENYTKSFEIYWQLYKEYPDKQYQYIGIDCLITAFILGWSSQENISEIKKSIVHVLMDLRDFFMREGQIRTNLFHGIIESSVKKKDDILMLFDVELLNLYENAVQQKCNPFVIIDLYDAAKKVRIKLKRSIFSWELRRAKASEQLVDLSEDKSGLTTLSWLESAIEGYRRGGDNQKVEELLKLHEKLSANAKYQTFSYETDMSEVYKNYDEISQQLILEGPEKTLIYLSKAGEILIPTYESVQKEALVFCRKNPIMGFASHQILDEYGHPCKTYEGSEGSQEHWTIHCYKERIEAFVLELVKQILFKAVSEGNLSTESIISFFNEYSWFSQVIFRDNGDGNKIEYRWVNSLLPAIHDYIIQMTMYFNVTDFFPNFILSIDSLTIKIESIIRDLLKTHGSTITEYKEKGGDKKIEMQTLEKLLDNPLLENLMGKDDVFFFKIILTEKAGYNLRARIAHGLMINKEYSLHYMHLVLLIVLRLSRFRLTKVEEQQ